MKSVARETKLPAITFAVVNVRTAERFEGTDPEALLESIPIAGVVAARDWCNQGCLTVYTDGRVLLTCPLFGAAELDAAGRLTLHPMFRAMHEHRIVGFPPLPLARARLALRVEQLRR